MKIATGMGGWMLRWAILFVIVLSANALWGQVKEHKHDKILPAPESVWYSCCHDHDCREASLRVQFLNDNWALVAIADYPPIRVRRGSVYRSENGKSYFCTLAGTLPPTEQNILCVFYVDPSMVKNGEKKKST